jgi:hypothetical protein
LKIHNKTGLKYLGYTKSTDPFGYRGSGIEWCKHIKEHGYNVTTFILGESTNKKEVLWWGSYFSDLWDIVQSQEFTNLIPETGSGSPIWDEERKKEYQKWWTPERRKEWSEREKEKLLDSEYKKTLIQRATSEYTKQRMVEHNKKYKSKEMKARWSNPEYREKGLNHLKQIRNPEIVSRQMKNLWSDPNRRTKMLASRVNVTCPHCLKEGSKGNMIRWHFNHCKSLQSV